MSLTYNFRSLKTYQIFENEHWETQTLKNRHHHQICINSFLGTRFWNILFMQMSKIGILHTNFGCATSFWWLNFGRNPEFPYLNIFPCPLLNWFRWCGSGRWENIFLVLNHVRVCPLTAFFSLTCQTISTKFCTKM